LIGLTGAMAPGKTGLTALTGTTAPGRTGLGAVAPGGTTGLTTGMAPGVTTGIGTAGLATATTGVGGMETAVGAMTGVAEMDGIITEATGGGIVGVGEPGTAATTGFTAPTGGGIVGVGEPVPPGGTIGRSPVAVIGGGMVGTGEPGTTGVGLNPPVGAGGGVGGLAASAASPATAPATPATASDSMEMAWVRRGGATEAGLFSDALSTGFGIEVAPVEGRRIDGVAEEGAAGGAISRRAVRGLTCGGATGAGG
jgi:hypothetical protein